MASPTKTLSHKGYSVAGIDEAIKEFYKDEATKYDDKLIKIIEKKFMKGKAHKGELLQDIFADLVKEGHKPFEIEKAMLRANFRPHMKVKTAMRRWEAYSIIQICILITTILLTIFYNLIFVIAVFAILISMVAASMGVPKVHAEWRRELGMVPGIGLWTRDGIFGYNSTTGNYWRWRTLDPAIVVSAVYLFLAIFFIRFGLLFVLICVYLAMISSICFTIKPPDTSGPPYHPILND